MDDREKFSTDYFFALKKAVLVERLDRAKEKAPSLAVVDELQEKADKINAQFLNGEISADQCEAKMNSLESYLDYTVVFNTPTEYRLALEILSLSGEEFEYCLEHEMDHYNKARQNGFRARLCLKFYKVGGKLGIIPSTRIRMVLDGSDDILRHALRQVVSAPKDLSNSDKRSIGVSN